MPPAPAFDPNSASTPESGVFGLPYIEKDAALVCVPVPWEATVSYGGGTAKAPAAVLRASRQVDLFDGDVEKPYAAGLFWRREDPKIRAINARARAAARKIIAAGGAEGKKSLQKPAALVNALGAELNARVKKSVADILDAGKIPAVLGGDHAVPYGAFAAAAQKHGNFGLLHFDAHHDMRKDYEGFRWSHASIMRNALDGIPAISRIVQVGIRDFCEEEADYAEMLGPRAAVFYEEAVRRRMFAGEPWDEIARDIVSHLPQKVWITFDVDGLDPSLCPHTGTPVPGGLSFFEANRILREVAVSGREILGFDLVEISPPPRGQGDWDANVGARLLYKLTAWTLASRGLAKVR
ncbi:MAG TPA: agmatinase family protein [Elusimicrobiota bacterium]|nr:agmatinase family protein [Elusimicrobiota bacterium]